MDEEDKLVNELDSLNALWCDTCFTIYTPSDDEEFGDIEHHKDSKSNLYWVSWCKHPWE